MIRASLCLLAVLLPAPTATAQWVRVESPHFVVFGEVGEKRTRDYAGEFERFREALGRVVPGAAARPAVPTVVFIFKDARSFAPHRPLFNGKPVEVSGYFAGGPSLDVIMMPATSREQALRTIYHEYSHLVTANAARGLPVWLSEGLAEYYSTFEVRDDGRRALLGGIIPAHLMRLNTERMLPLEQLLSVDHDSPLYNEGARRSDPILDPMNGTEASIATAKMTAKIFFIRTPYLLPIIRFACQVYHARLISYVGIDEFNDIFGRCAG
jgi:hypothetical protein